MAVDPHHADDNPDDPNPGQSSVTLEAFVQQVQQRLGLETEPEAEVLVRAVLNELGQSLSKGMAQDLTTALPPELSAEIRSVSSDQARKIDRTAFVDNVSGAVHSVDFEKVEHQVTQVLQQLRSWLPADEADRALAQLPNELEQMMR